MAMDAFSASLMADKREIIFAPTVYKFQAFAQMAEEFNLNERDVVLTNEFIYTPFMKELGLPCSFVFQEKFGAGEPSEAMIQTMYDAIPYDSYDRVIAVGGGGIPVVRKNGKLRGPPAVIGVKSALVPVLVVAYPTFLYLPPIVVVVPGASTTITPIRSAFHPLSTARVFGPLTPAVIRASTGLFCTSLSCVHAANSIAAAAIMKNLMFIVIILFF